MLWAYPAAGTNFLSSVEFCSGVWICSFVHPALNSQPRRPLLSRARAEKRAKLRRLMSIKIKNCGSFRTTLAFIRSLWPSWSYFYRPCPPSRCLLTWNPSPLVRFMRLNSAHSGAPICDHVPTLCERTKRTKIIQHGPPHGPLVVVGNPCPRMQALSVGQPTEPSITLALGNPTRLHHKPVPWYVHIKRRYRSTSTRYQRLSTLKMRFQSQK